MVYDGFVYDGVYEVVAKVYVVSVECKDSERACEATVTITEYDAE